MSFIDFARAHGVEINLDKFAPRDRVQRCPTTEKPRSKNGSYFWDGRRGWVFAWDGEARVQWYDDPNAKPWTDEEKQEWAARRRRQREEQQQLHIRAARHAAELMATTVPGTHDYLIRKKLPAAQGLRLPDGGLLVPMRDVATNEMRGAQIIRWASDEETGEMRWTKKMLYGMQAQGAVLRLGPKHARELVLCEGYATGLSIELALRQMRLVAAVLVCFNDSNMVLVAGKTTGRRYCFADHDDMPKPERAKRDRGEPFEARGPGELAAIATGLPYCISPVLGEDANDMHARAGLTPLCSLLMAARRGAAM